MLAGLALLLACGDSSDGGGEETSKASAAERLTELMHFEGGTVRSGKIQEPTNRTVMLSASKGTVTLDPDQPASILALDVDNSDEEPVSAFLLQFGDEDSHVEVDKEVEPSAAPTEVELSFEIDDTICDELCATTFEVKVKQAAKLADDAVTEAETVTMVLDCTDHGDPKLCTGDEPEPAQPEPDAGEADSGPPPEADAGSDAGMPDAGELVDLATLAADLSTAFAADHDALCMNCTDPSRIPCYAVVPSGAITCIEDAVTAAAGTSAAIVAVGDLLATIESIEARCTACDFDTCGPAALDDHLTQLPADLATEIEACITP